MSKMTSEWPPSASALEEITISDIAGGQTVVVFTDPIHQILQDRRPILRWRELHHQGNGVGGLTGCGVVMGVGVIESFVECAAHLGGKFFEILLRLAAFAEAVPSVRGQSGRGNRRQWQ